MTDGDGEGTTRYLVATASERTTKAACEYLTERLADGDEVLVVTVATPGEAEASDVALDVAQARLAGLADVGTYRLSGTPAREIVGFARDREVDEIVVGASRSGAAGQIGSTTRSLLATVDVPVFVVPGAET